MSYWGDDRRKSTSQLIKETRLTDDDEASSEHGEQKRDNKIGNEPFTLIESDPRSITPVGSSRTSQKSSGEILQNESTSNNVVSVGTSESAIESVTAHEASQPVSEGRLPANVIIRRAQLGGNAPAAARSPPSRRQIKRIHHLLAQRTAWRQKLKIAIVAVSISIAFAVSTLSIAGAVWLPTADKRTVEIFSVIAVVAGVLCILACVGLWFLGVLMRLLDPLNDDKEEEEERTVSQGDGEADLASTS